jgi:uncharacterized protein (DUF58 family)
VIAGEWEYNWMVRFVFPPARVFSGKEHNMLDEKFRRRVAWEAARMMYGHEEPECFRAKMKAARRIHRGKINPRDLPTDREIRQQLAVLTEMHRNREGQHRLREAHRRVEFVRIDDFLKQNVLQTINPLRRLAWRG